MGRARHGATASVASPRRRRREDRDAPGTHVGTVQRVTSKGVPVRMELYSDADKRIKEGWVVELIEAHTPQGPAGYLKLAFIPEEEMRRRFPTAFEWSIRECGRYLGVRALLDKPEEQWTRQDTLHALRSCDEWQPADAADRAAELRESSDDRQLLALWHQRREEIRSRHENTFQAFRAFHLDRPNVDYSCVYGERERSVYVDGVRVERKQPLGYESRRQGIATVMYETGALWMHARGMRMHASGLQSDEAESVWARFEAQGLIKTVPGARRPRRVLDADQLLRAHPELADSTPGVHAQSAAS